MDGSDVAVQNSTQKAPPGAPFGLNFAPPHQSHPSLFNQTFRPSSPILEKEFSQTLGSRVLGSCSACNFHSSISCGSRSNFPFTRVLLNPHEMGFRSPS